MTVTDLDPTDPAVIEFLDWDSNSPSSLKAQMAKAIGRLWVKREFSSIIGSFVDVFLYHLELIIDPSFSRIDITLKNLTPQTLLTLSLST